MRRALFVGIAPNAIKSAADDPLAELSPDEVAFLDAVASGKGIVEAARKSGLVDEGASDYVARRRALTALSDRRLANGLKALLMARSLSLAASALAQVEHVAANAKSDRTRLEAAKLILELALGKVEVQAEKQNTPPSFGIQVVDVEPAQSAEARREPERIPLFREE